MPRPATGAIESHHWRDHTTVTWRLRVRAYGRRWCIDLGTNHEGWNEERAQVELDQVQAQIARGTWQPPSKDDVAVAAPDPESETVHVTASRWWQRHRGELRPNTRADYQWRLAHLLAILKDTPTSELDARRVDELRDALVARGLSARSVNMVLGLLAQILDDAVDYGLLGSNPARGRRRRMKVKPAARSFLEPDMIVDLLDVAGEWENELRPHQRYGRRALLAWLCLSGPRISEAVLADRGELDLASGRWRIPAAKTDAGRRDIDLTAFVADELRAHAASRDLDPAGPMFPTRTGGRLNDHNLRARLFPEVVSRANERRAKAGKLLLPERVTPHTLRRTFASLCFFAGRDPRFVMSQLGHADARLTLAVYAQTLERRRVDHELVWALMRFMDEPEQPPNGPTGQRAPEGFGTTNDTTPSDPVSDTSATLDP
ncbi:tyrosine-type recombinase/integrase [Baekduia soli]|uniref:Tyrosine-type recombinase/integrase n=1 Tax=Baekduia soli TaxID=496014 RepID=A0A5B8U1Z6_9ACTN|nr:tyrosine-type recombinase/integrase [Baekduia soli]QEC47017.1 tyrosine-type recombinase/integrase [Baekduia soli]